MSKQRLDHILAEKYPEYSRTQLQGWIMQGRVFVNDLPITKAGHQVDSDDRIELRVEQPKFVCRAGLKLDHALEHFKVDVRDAVILDAGLSTGGFSQCMLQRGAAKIFGVDVGYGQVDYALRQDPRLVVMERTNLRHLTELPGGEKVDLVTLDLSFISILKVMDAVCALLKDDGQLVTLIKPQFEAERHQVGKGGIIRDPAVHAEVVKKVVAGIEARGFVCRGVIDSPITGTTGNKEFLAHFMRNK